MPVTVMMMVATELYSSSQLHYQEPGGYFRRQLSPLQNVDKHIPFRFPVIILQSTNLPLATLLHQFTMLSHNYSSPNYWVVSVYICVSVNVCVRISVFLSGCASVCRKNRADNVGGGRSQSSRAQKAKVLDTHLPSLKRRRLNDITGAHGINKICIEYESEVHESQRRPVNLLDALEQGDHRNGGEDDAAGEEKAHRLSTMSLQHDKRLDDELRGGKRKIKLVQEQKVSVSEVVSEENKASKAKKFLAEMKKSLSQVNFERIVQALQTYKKNDDLDALLAETMVLAEDTNTHSLLWGFYQFVRPHHKKRFDEKCQELTGRGCGYVPDHSLSKDEKKALMLHTAKDGQHSAVLSSSSSSGASACNQLNTQQLNKGGHHLSHQGLRETQTGSASKNEVHSTFLADVRKTLGTERSAQLFQAIRCYKTTDNYENLVTTVVSLLTEKEEDFNLLIRFGVFIRSHHKKQYKEMLASLTGQSLTDSDVAVSEDQQTGASSSSCLKTQSKISSFFSS